MLYSVLTKSRTLHEVQFWTLVPVELKCCMSECTIFGLEYLRLNTNAFCMLTFQNPLCDSSIVMIVAVVQAQNVILQIGEQNNVYICDQDPASSCEHRHAERVNNVSVTDENGVQSAIG